jgi:hypothetical protein
MDLHTDIKTGETRNILRLLYSPGLTLQEAMKSVSTILSGHLCELLRGHSRAFAQADPRNDGRIASASSAYSFSRARHRRLFEVLELYTTKYPLFWKWTEEIFGMAKAQITESGIKEDYVTALKRSVTCQVLPDSPKITHYDGYYGMVSGQGFMYTKSQGVSGEVKGTFGGRRGARALQCSDGVETLFGLENILTWQTDALEEIHTLWHTQILSSKDLAPGWGKSLDIQSDALLGRVGHMFLGM